MTYIPVDDEARKGHGRTPLEIPGALLAQLYHSKATGAVCYIDLDGTENPEEIAELKRAIIRAGYRHFSENTITKKFRPNRIEYSVGPKKKGNTPRNGGTE